MLSEAITSVSNMVATGLDKIGSRPSRKDIALQNGERRNFLYETVFGKEMKTSQQKVNESEAFANAESNKRVLSFVFAALGCLIVLVLFASLLKNKKR